ncbi:hypothetical protein FRC10_008689 [Ceratobasidium sp. 414]|nr:hypothetical protein FRC10_008689 [Ceratobasidium sp. 414]
MSVWNISAVFTNVTTAWERGFSSPGTVRRKDTSVLLHEINELLQDTSKLLEHHGRLFPPGEYETFKAQHRSYHWRLSDEKKRSEDSDETLHQSTSQFQAEKETNRVRAAKLLETVKTYRTTLLVSNLALGSSSSRGALISIVQEASRNVADGPHVAFPDEDPVPTDQPPAHTQMTPPGPTERTSPRPTVIPTRHPSSLGVSKITVLPTSQGFAIAIAHIPVDPEKDLYERLISVKIGDHQIQIPDEKKLAGVFMLVGKSLLESDDLQKTVEELRREID